MGVNLHENGKQQESPINSFVVASGTLIIILCSLLDTCSWVLCVSPRSLRVMPPLTSPSALGLRLSSVIVLYRVVTCSHQCQHSRWTRQNIINHCLTIILKGEKEHFYRPCTQCHRIKTKLGISMFHRIWWWHYLTTFIFRCSYLVRCSGLVSGVTISWNLLQSESWEFDLIEQKTRIELKLTQNRPELWPGTWAW